MVKIRPYRKRGKSGWEVDIIVRLPTGEPIRERVKAPVTSKSGALAWGREREAVLLREGMRPRKTAAPTLAEFWPDFVKGYIEANRQKPSTIVTSKSIYETHLEPAFGSLRLDAITDEKVQTFKGGLSDRSPKTLNNVLTVLSKALRIAVEWERIDRLPCRIRLVKVQKPSIEFYEPADYERLLDGAQRADERTHTFSRYSGATRGYGSARSSP